MSVRIRWDEIEDAWRVDLARGQQPIYDRAKVGLLPPGMPRHAGNPPYAIPFAIKLKSSGFRRRVYTSRNYKGVMLISGGCTRWRPLSAEARFVARHMAAAKPPLRHLYEKIE